MHYHHGQLKCLPIVPGYRLHRDHWTVFTCIRNHFDVAVSWVWRRTRGQGWPWGREKFEWALTFPVNRWVGENTFYHLHADDADEILRYEEFPDNLYEILNRFNLPKVSLGRYSESRGNDGRSYRDFYTDDGVAYIQNRFGDEIRRFGYEF